MALKEHYSNLNELKADVMHEMRDILHEWGWIKGALHRSGSLRGPADGLGNGDGVCFMGALNTVISGSPHYYNRKSKNNPIFDTLPFQRRYAYDQIVKEFKKHLEEMFGRKQTIERWNDFSNRTEEEVEKAIMQMADYYETRYLEGLQS